MSRGLSVNAGNLVARSLRVTRSTHLLVASIAAAVASNAALAMQFAGLIGLIVAPVLIFATLTVGVSAISSEIYSRSSQAVSNLRSIGASSRSLSSAVLIPVLIYVVLGAALGAIVGAGLGMAMAGSQGAAALLMDIPAVVLACSAASAVGVYVGGRAAWRS
jgi:predicted lysophospholipase L1 biosynthesis ABC-type transport system permease subunit